MCRKLFRTVWFSFLRLLIDKKNSRRSLNQLDQKGKSVYDPVTRLFFLRSRQFAVLLTLSWFVIRYFCYFPIFLIVHLITLFWNSIKKRFEPQYSGQLRVGTCENRRWRKFFDEFYRHCRSKRSGRQAECRKKIHLRYYQSCWGKFTRG